ncbi:aldehyde dehydrogenase family protein [Mycoplasmopsis cynos]|uniref:aldehyde dehydrogenase family protein n=1 Tax=Mycoplasmopsis cynos TaxID=171284 RepID=UPI002AFEEE8F|nr:aldehyde dehydrogenase family protein [Mycoplasmopsis cynos]WQQ15238.1 aldehyde dehydrogenase family protein [Mycoplasmopsis cynos]
MNTKNYQIFLKQKENYLNNGPLDLKTRIKILKKLKELIMFYQSDIEKVLYLDLKKTPSQAFYSEISLIYNSINLTLKKLKKWTRPKSIKTPWFLFGSKSYIKYEAYGVVGIYSPWNYPFLLSFDPIIAAISAGNRIILKASEVSENSWTLINKIINDNFDDSIMYCSSNDMNEFKIFNELNFDLIFFTGSSNIGKIIAENAAKNLIPTILELGGKSPSIIFDDANIKSTVKNIIFGKFLNSGQICTAHDYILIDNKIKDEFYQEFKRQLNEYKLYDNFGKIINQKHFNRILSLLDNDKLSLLNKNESKLTIEPFVYFASQNERIMQEEIFGPILPILSFENFNELKNILQKQPNPLVIYLFGKNKRNFEIEKYFKSGSVIINNTISFLSNTYLPFGGVGNSGNGRYHGYEGFKSFSNPKSFFKSFAFIKPSFLTFGKETNFKKQILEWIFKK